MKRTWQEEDVEELSDAGSQASVEELSVLVDRLESIVDCLQGLFSQMSMFASLNSQQQSKSLGQVSTNTFSEGTPSMTQTTVEEDPNQHILISWQPFTTTTEF